MNKRKENIEIDLLDMLRSIMYHWRSGVVCIIIITILGAGYCVFKNESTNKNLVLQNQNEKTDEKKVQIAGDKEQLEVLASKASLSEIEKNTIKVAASMYTILNDRYSKMSLTTGNRLVFQYAIKVKQSEGTSKDIANTMVYAIAQYIRNGGLASAIVDDGYKDMTVVELTDRLSIDYVGVNQAGVPLNANDMNISNISISPFVVILEGTSDKKSNELITYINGELKEFVKSYKNLGEIELLVLSKYHGKVKDDYNTDINTITIYDQFNSVTDKFSDKQKAIFNIIIGKDVLEVSDPSILNSITTSNQNSEETIVKKVSLLFGLKHHCAFALLLGIFLYGMYYTLIYLFDNTVKTRKDFAEVFGWYCLGNLSIRNEKKRFGARIDRLLDRLFNKKLDSFGKREELCCANIKALCAKKNIQKICIVSSLGTADYENKCIDSLITQLKKNVEVLHFENVLENVVEFDTFVNTGTAIFFEKPTITKYNKIEEIIDICDKYHINVLGVICC